MALVLLTTVDSTIQAGLICSKLESEDIACYQLNGTFSSLMPQFYGIMGAGIQIMVNDDKLAQARSLIQSDKVEVICPQCQSKNISATSSSGWNRLKLFFIIFFLSGPVGNLLHTFVCQDCGHTFKR